MRKEYLYAGLSIVLWSTTATTAKLLLRQSGSMQVLFAVSSIACVFLLVFNFLKGSLKGLSRYGLRDFAKTGLLGLLGIFSYNAFLYLAFESLLAQEAFIINYMWPILTVLFSCVILKEKMTIRKGAALLLSFLGVVVVITRGNIGSMHFASLKGAVFALLAAVCYSLFSVLNKRESYNQSVSMMLYYLVSALISGIYLAVAGDLAVAGGLQLAGYFWMGVFTSAVAYTTWALALKSGDTAKVSNLAFVTPFLSLVFIGIFLHEVISPFSLAGLAMIVAGVMLQMRDRKKMAGSAGISRTGA